MSGVKILEYEHAIVALKVVKDHNDTSLVALLVDCETVQMLKHGLYAVFAIEEMMSSLSSSSRQRRMGVFTTSSSEIASKLTNTKRGGYSIHMSPSSLTRSTVRDHTSAAGQLWVWACCHMGSLAG